jgi:hypothetical protein
VRETSSDTTGQVIRSANAHPISPKMIKTYVFSIFLRPKRTTNPQQKLYPKYRIEERKAMDELEGGRERGWRWYICTGLLRLPRGEAATAERNPRRLHHGSLACCFGWEVGGGRRRRLNSKCGAGWGRFLNGILLLDLWAQTRALVWTEDRRLGPPRDSCGQLH